MSIGKGVIGACKKRISNLKNDMPAWPDTLLITLRGKSISSIKIVTKGERVILKTEGFEETHDIDIALGYGSLGENLCLVPVNGIGMVQGGALFTLADYAFGVAANADGSTAVGINASISYFRTPKGVTIYAEAMEERSNKKICGYKVLVKDEDGSLVASFAGLGYRKYTATVNLHL